MTWAWVTHGHLLAGCEGAWLQQPWGDHHQPACQHSAQHGTAQQTARQHPTGQRGAAQPCREGGELPDQVVAVMVVALAVVDLRSNLGLYDCRMLLRSSLEVPRAMSTANPAAM